MTALPASPRPLSEPHPLLAPKKNNFRSDAQLTRDGHEHRRRIPIIAIDGLPALAHSISTDRATDRPLQRLNPVPSDLTPATHTARPIKRRSFCLPSFQNRPNQRRYKPKLTVETQTDKPAIDLKAAFVLPAVTSAPALTRFRINA